MTAFATESFNTKTGSKTHTGVNGRPVARLTSRRHRTIEDAHICQPSIPLSDGSDVVFFGGHGGELVTFYCERHPIETLLGTPAFQEFNFKEVMEDVSMLIDDQPRTQQVNSVRHAHR